MAVTADRVMELIDEPLPGVKVIALRPHGDERGRFVETHNQAKLAALGIDATFVQDNESTSRSSGTVRGLHFQLAPHAQGKLVRVLAGAIVDVAVDIRPDVPTFRHHVAVHLSADDDLALWIPEGFAHGFCTTEPDTTLAYKVTALYEPAADRSIRWDDPDLGIDWPVDPDRAVLSAKDASAPRLRDIEGELS